MTIYKPNGDIDIKKELARIESLTLEELNKEMKDDLKGGTKEHGNK